MTANGYLIGDGSWTLTIRVPDFHMERKLRVKGDLHIGGVMLKLVEDLDIAVDWSDYALWWPSQNKWLTRTRFTLDQYGVQADAVLDFTAMHKVVRLQLPDLRYLDRKVDFSVKTFNAVVQLCKELGIRHPEELSFCKPLEPSHLKHNWKDVSSRRPVREYQSNGVLDTNTLITSKSRAGSNGSLDNSSLKMNGTPLIHSRYNHTASTSSPATPTGTWKRNGCSKINGNVTSLEWLNGDLKTSLASSPESLSYDARATLLRPKSLVEKARMNVCWLDSSLSIMEQGINEYDTLRLRYKFYSFYDLNPKTDAVRINMIYEQAKWMLLNEELDCSAEEALMFAALQVQINLQATIPQSGYDTYGVNGKEDDIDAALTDLQMTLNGSQIESENEINHIPELYDYLRFLKPKKFTLKAFKRYWFVCNSLQLRLYKNQVDSVAGGPPVHVINLKGCEVTPDVNLAQNKFGIRLEIPSAEGMSEVWIRCDTEEQYAKWMAACKLAAKGKTLSDNCYESEMKSIINFLELQRPALTPAISPSSLDISAEDYLSPKYCKKFKHNTVKRILEAHANVKDLASIEAKLSYIKAWQSLPDFGVSLFIVRFMGAKKDELLGIAPNKIMKININTGDHIKTWRYDTMKEWHVNWEIRHMMIEFEEGDIIFACHSADCKVVHEFVGGYIFLSTRSKEANQSLNEELFHKLTGGWM